MRPSFGAASPRPASTPRHLVARALSLNTASLVIFHNHPSGLASPSLADQRLTHCLANLFSQIDIQLWEHLVVAGQRVVGLIRDAN
ncbi:MAG: JAB domain-containing protein [Burkholderiaceae bacterium]